MTRRSLAWLLVVLAGCNGEPPLYAVGTLERDRIEVAAESAEPVLSVDVLEGDRVAAGQLLVTQDPARARARLALLRAQREQAAARLEEAERGPRAETIAAAEARLRGARSARETAAAQLRREQSLAARDFASANELDVLQGRFDQARAGVEEAEAALDELRAGTRVEVIRQAREALAAAEAALAEQALTLSRTRLVAPVVGVVEALPVEAGERPQPGQTVAVLRARQPAYARVYLPEPLRARVAVGTRAEIRLDGRPEPLSGRVRWIAGEAAFTPYFALTQRDRSRLSYLAEVEATDAAADALPVGLPVEVHFPADGDR